MPPPLFNHITIIGLGLIGGSLARALKKNNVAAHITGCDSDTTIRRALKLGIIDTGENDPVKAAHNTELVVLCTPLGAYGELSAKIAPHLPANTIITDTGSAKQAVIAIVTKNLSPLQQTLFIPGHPIAGSEKSGIEAGFSELFKEKKTILTPLEHTSISALENIKKMWEQCGSHVELMNAEKHDRIYARVSHLPHLLGFCFIGMLGRMDYTICREDENFERFLRIAGSNVAMWRDILFFNKTSVLEALKETENEISHIDKLLENFNAVYEELKTAQQRRLQIKLPTTKLPIPENTSDALTYLLPKILACVVIKITEDIGYAGTGFRDFTSPLLELPENLANTLNEQRNALSHALNVISLTIQKTANTIANGTFKEIEDMLVEYKNSYDTRY